MKLYTVSYREAGEWATDLYVADSLEEAKELFKRNNPAEALYHWNEHHIDQKGFVATII